MKINFSRQFQALAERFGDREALVNIERNRRYSYRELHLLTNRIINMMGDALGLKAGDRFINILDNDNMSLLHFPTIFKGPYTGAWTNYRDVLSEHAWQVEVARPKVAFIENALLDSHYDMLRQHGVEIVCMDPLAEPRDGVHSFWSLVDNASDANPDFELDDREHIALIRFTGGTTGKGKPATYCIDNWLGLRDSFLAQPDKCWTSDARLLHLAPISHGSGLFYMPTFYSGGCTLTQNEPDLVKYVQNLAKEQVTHAFLVPTLLYRLLELPDVEQLDLSSLQNMFYGAAPMSAAKLKRLQQRFGNIFIQAYASTEHFAIALSLDKKSHLFDGEAGERRLASAGQVTPGVELEIKDDDGSCVAQGECGEIWLRSRGVCLGYLDNPEKTAEEFVDGFWKSGDIGYQDEQGYVYLVDRKKDMIISGGFNIYANEVEAALNAHPAVLMSAVVGVPHEEWGEAVHAEVVMRDGESLSEQDLLAFVKERIGSYKAPKSLTFSSQLPVSVVGKLLRRKVREKYWSEGRQVG